jgi:glycosyltransferase involved in cell wall biosynthesis
MPAASSFASSAIVSDGRSREAAERPRVAIFQAHWRLHSNAVYSALMLAEAGYRVDVFLYKVDISLPTDMLTRSPRIFVHCFEPETLRAGNGSTGRGRSAHADRPWSQRMAHRVFLRGRSAVKKVTDLGLLLLGSDVGLIPGEIIRRTVEIIGDGRYRALIGVEKGGLVWAGAVARSQPSALIYLNLELFTADVWSTWGVWYKRMKAAEDRAHQHCWATIVQDPTRGRILLKDNNIKQEMRILYLPISRLGGRKTVNSRWLQTSLGLPGSNVVVLSHGMISEDRHATELAKAAQSFEDDWVLVFHGWGWNLHAVMQSVSKIDKKNRVRFSLKLVDLSEEALVTASAHVTLALYNKTSINDRLSGFASEKVGLSLQCGVPVIAFNYPTYEHIENEGCGVLVNDLSEVTCAIRKILSDYAAYRERAFAAFDRHYSFEMNFKQILDALAL